MVNKIKILRSPFKESPLYKFFKEATSKKTVRTKIAFEFGLVLAETAKSLKIELTSEISQRAEEILLNEFKINGTKKTALNFTPLILAALETE